MFRPTLPAALTLATITARPLSAQARILRDASPQCGAFGANIATTLHADLDISIGALAVPRGDYTLSLLHTASNAWQLIVSSQTSQ
ncbi:MAG TPA: DUF2911 domain-containing protein [Gemmatimonadaceae bacterium]